MEEHKPPSVELAEKLVETDQDYVNMMMSYWGRQKEEALRALEVADKELNRFREMKE